MNDKQKETPTPAEVSEFLIALRDSGVVNMFGAAPYLQDKFGVDYQTAKALLIAWIESFNEVNQ